jgi:putative membrane protein insertion efficiency factor
VVFVWGWGGGGPRRRRGWGGRRGPGDGGYGQGYGQGYGPGYGPGYGRGYGGYRRGYGAGGGGGCLRDLFLLNTGCCLAESLGCGMGLLRVAPSMARHVRAVGPTGTIVDRLVAAVRVYQREVSSHRGPCCSFTPTCSEYAVQALEHHGARRGSWLTVRRLLRCRPGAAGGPDPVPPRRLRTAPLPVSDR